MYEEPTKLTKNKKIELIVLIVLIIWGLLFIVNYVRYTQSKSLFLAIHVKDDSYEDGYIEEYISFGYIYRLYQRNAISREELVPFWIGRENPESESALPKPLTDYEVPDNPKRADKFRGLLYYFDQKGDLLGTYKCLNSSSDCEKATDGHDLFNTKNKDPLTKVDVPHTLSSIHDKYAFVDDSYPQETKYGDAAYSRTIYLYQFTDKDTKILARYADVKESTYDKDYEKSMGDSYRYIVKSYENNKWGIIKINESGSIDEVLPFEYDSISYDEDTKYYILCKNEKWFIYDLENSKNVTEEIDVPIYDVWRNTNLTYYYKTGKDRVVGNDSFVDYKVYRIDGKKFIDGDRITQVVERDKTIFYITSTDNVLHFVDYSGEEKYKIQLAFSDMNYDYTRHPAFEIWYEKGDYITFRVYKGREKSYDFDTISVNVSHWEYNN